VNDASAPSPPSSGPPTSGSAAVRPRRLGVAAVLTGLEGVAIAASGLVMLVLVVVGEPDGVTQAVTGALTLLLLAVLPLAAGHGLWRLRRWSRGPAVVTQILALPTAWHMYGIGGAWRPAAALLAAAALVILVALTSPAAAEALGVLRRSGGPAGARDGVPPK
jgi:uncharacterized membrane protein (DUF2068 family)